MTKHEKAVLRAAKARMKTLMAAYNFLTYDAVIYDQRGKKGPAAALDPRDCEMAEGERRPLNSN